MYRVIIVDDEPLIRNGLRNTIEWDELSLEISGEASNGTEALKLIKEVKPQIIITDIKMPVMDGLELIKRIHSLNSKIRIIVLSGYSDYQFLKEAIKYNVESYLLKPIDNDELISILKSTVENIESEINTNIQQREGLSALRTNTLNRLFTNNISAREYKEKAELFNLSTKASKYLVAVAALCNFDETDYESNNNYQLMQFGVFNICEELVTTKGFGDVFMDTKGCICFLFNDQSCDLNYDVINAFVQETIYLIKHFLKLTIRVGVGFIVESLHEIYKSSNCANECLEYGILANGEGFIQYAESGLKNSIMDEIKIDYELLENYIKLEKKEELEKYIENYYDELSRLSNLSIEYIRNSTMHIIINIIKVFSETSGDTKKIINSLDFKYIDFLKLKRLDEFKTWLKVFFQKIYELAVDNMQKKVSKVVNDSLDYIDRHCYEEISLKLIADKIYINASYLGQIFKKEIGESFTDYVNKLRMQKAKELLVSTNLKVYEVSERVGFKDSHYFIKIFKKYVGVNPSDIKRG